MLFGVLNIDKPEEWTSHDVVAKVRRCFNTKKVGHAGTLDPLATGVLPVCLGDATRLIEYFPSDKQYRAEIQFGIETTTWDAEGDTVNESDASSLTAELVQIWLSESIGTIEQTVPPHSAVHVNGKKLYELTRKGISVELPTRPVEIYRYELIDFVDAGTPRPVAVVDIHCASGTYVRSMAQDLGQKSGHGAYLMNLIRTAHGQMTIADSVPLSELLESPHPELYLRNPADALRLNKIILTPSGVEKIRVGMKLQPVDLSDERIYPNRPYCLLFQEKPIAIAKGDAGGRLKPVKVFPSQLPDMATTALQLS